MHNQSIYRPYYYLNNVQTAPLSFQPGLTYHFDSSTDQKFFNLAQSSEERPLRTSFGGHIVTAGVALASVERDKTPLTLLLGHLYIVNIH